MKSPSALFARTPLAQALQRSLIEQKIATLKALAKKIGVGYRSLHGVVKGTSLPNARTESKYQKFLDLSASTYQKIVHESQPTAALGKSDAIDSAVQALQQALFKQFLSEIPLSVYYALQELNPQDFVALEHWLKLPAGSRARVTTRGRVTAARKSPARRTTARRAFLPAVPREDQEETEADRLERARRATSFGIGRALLARLTPTTRPAHRLAAQAKKRHPRGLDATVSGSTW